MSNKLEATFGPSKAPSSPGVMKQARDLCGRDIGRTVKSPSGRVDGVLRALEHEPAEVTLYVAGNWYSLAIDATVTITGTPAP